MKDIPMFTTPYGVAGLALKEIPYQKTAYINILSAIDCDKLLEECVSFCNACGAEKIYARGDQTLEMYPVYTAVWLMRCDRFRLLGESANVFPVLPENVETWRDIYNRRMAKVPNASYMTELDGKELCSSGEGYYIHHAGKLVGIGRVSADQIRVIASVVKGAGELIVRTLAELAEASSISVEVASENHSAVYLYQRLGFLKIAEISKWYCVFDGEYKEI